MNFMFTGMQIYGLLFLNWSGLYVLYLYWVELLLFSIYLGIRYWKLIHSSEWLTPEVYKCITNRPKEIKAEFATFVLYRSYLLALYFLLIGVVIVPVEYDLKSVETIRQFWSNVAITDPLFIIAAFLIVSYYLKLIFERPHYSKITLVLFSFDVATNDPRIFSPFFAVFGFPFMALFYLMVKDNAELHSNTYFFTMMLLFIRLAVDFYLVYIIREELKKQELI